MNLTVSTLVRYLKNRLDSDRYLQNILVEGEISNFRHYQSGYIYFTLKDNKAAISCMMFPRDAYALRFDPKDGDQVLVKGDVSVYEASGQLQLYVKQMKPNGLGDLYLQYEELKRKLAAAGFFDESHKKERTEFPFRIAVLVGDKSAAMSDIKTCFARRWPVADVDYYPVLVQGKDAAADIVSMLLKVDQMGYDAVILARGGGSFEDLFAFNDEALVKTIYHLNTFIITGIGHEQDYTLSDFAADLRAPTPTAAVELLTPQIIDVFARIADLNMHAESGLRAKINDAAKRLKDLEGSPYFREPGKLTERSLRRLEFLETKLYNTNKRYTLLQQDIDSRKLRMQKALMYRIRENSTKLDNYIYTLSSLTNQKFKNERVRLKRLEVLLKAYSSENILEKGYALVFQQEKLIKSIEDVDPKQNIRVRMKDGTLDAKIEEVLHD